MGLSGGSLNRSILQQSCSSTTLNLSAQSKSALCKKFASICASLSSISFCSCSLAREKLSKVLPNFWNLRKSCQYISFFSKAIFSSVSMFQTLYRQTMRQSVRRMSKTHPSTKNAFSVNLFTLILQSSSAQRAHGLRAKESNHQTNCTKLLACLQRLCCLCSCFCQRPC